MPADTVKSTLLAVFLLLVAAAVLMSTRLRSPEAVDWGGPQPIRVESTYSQLPLLFVENRGQRGTDAAYYAEGQSTTIDFHAAGLTYELGTPPESAATPTHPERIRLDLAFVGATPRQPVAEAKQVTKVSYFGSSSGEQYRDLSTFAALQYKELWPGIDLVYSGTVNRMKYHFRIAPGADPKAIRLAWSGAKDVRINAAGGLDVVTPVNTLTDERPVAWQEIDGERIPVDVAFALGERTGDGQTYGFKLGSYDPAHELVLDPAVFIYSGYLSEWGRGSAIATDAHGSAYVAGYEVDSGARQNGVRLHFSRKVTRSLAKPAP